MALPDGRRRGRPILATGATPSATRGQTMLAALLAVALAGVPAAAWPAVSPMSPSPLAPDPVALAVQRNLPEFLDLLAIPNVASEPSDIQRNAAFLKTALEKRGFRTQLLDNPARRPLVFAQLDAP